MSGRVGYNDARVTLSGMFPLLEQQLIDDVLAANEGHLEKTVDYLLEISPAASALHASEQCSNEGRERDSGESQSSSSEVGRERDIERARGRARGRGRGGERGRMSDGERGREEVSIGADEEYARALQYELFESDDVYIPELEIAFRHEPEVLAFLSQQQRETQSDRQSLPLSSLLSSAQGAIRSSLMTFFSSRESSQPSSQEMTTNAREPAGEGVYSMSHATGTVNVAVEEIVHSSDKDRSVYETMFLSLSSGTLKKRPRGSYQ